MSTPTAPVEPMVHDHRDCAVRDRVWLTKDRGSSASATQHPYCLGCGTVRDLTWPRARPLGYYMNGVAALKEYLDHGRMWPKLAQVQTRLISIRLASRHEFDDPYGTPGQRQLDVYTEIVRSIRPDLDEDLILRLLPIPHAPRMTGAEGAETARTMT